MSARAYGGRGARLQILFSALCCALGGGTMAELPPATAAAAPAMAAPDSAADGADAPAPADADAMVAAGLSAVAAVRFSSGGRRRAYVQAEHKKMVKVYAKQGLQRLRVLSKSGVLSAFNSSLHQVRAVNASQMALMSGKSSFQAKSKEELANTPLWMQGDLSMNTKDAVLERSRLRQKPAIVAELQKWWETVGNSLRSGADTSIASVGKDEYVRINRLMAKSMTADFTEKEASAAAEEDWIEDAKGQDSLARQGFMDGIFELADVWTNKVDEKEYVEFLSTLLGKLANSPDGGKTFVWKEESEIEFWEMPEPESDEEEEEQPDSQSQPPPAQGAAATTTRLSAPPKPKNEAEAKMIAEKEAAAQVKAAKVAEEKAKAKADKEAKAAKIAQEKATKAAEAKAKAAEAKAKAEEAKAKAAEAKLKAVEVKKQEAAKVKAEKEAKAAEVKAKAEGKAIEAKAPAVKARAGSISQASTEAGQNAEGSTALNYVQVHDEATGGPPTVMSRSSAISSAAGSLQRSASRSSARGTDGMVRPGLVRSKTLPDLAPHETAEAVVGPRARKRAEKEKAEAEAGVSKPKSPPPAPPPPRPSAREMRQVTASMRQGMVEAKKAMAARSKAAELAARPRLPPSAADQERERPRPKSPSEAKRVLAQKRQELLDAKKARWALQSSATSTPALTYEPHWPQVLPELGVAKEANRQIVAQHKAYYASLGPSEAAVTYSAPEVASVRLQRTFRSADYLERVRSSELLPQGPVRPTSGSALKAVRDAVPEGPTRHGAEQVYRSLFAFEALGRCPTPTPISVLPSHLRAGPFTRSAGGKDVLPSLQHAYSLSGSSTSPRSGAIGAEAHAHLGSASWMSESAIGCESQTMFGLTDSPSLSRHGGLRSPRLEAPTAVPLHYFWRQMRDDTEISWVGGSAVFTEKRLDWSEHGQFQDTGADDLGRSSDTYHKGNQHG